MKTVKSNLYVKIGTIVLIAILLLIPATMIRSLIDEREHNYNETIREVSSKWSEEQTLTGPFISIPYYRLVEQISENETKVSKIKAWIHLLPEQLKITGTISPERRYRTIYEVVVYQSDLEISGNFASLRLPELDIPLQNIQFDKAFITLGLNDLRGIDQEIVLNINGNKQSFNPGVLSTDVVESGVHALIDMRPDTISKIDFSFKLSLKGSQKLYFTPLGKVNDIEITSTWVNPSFNGAFLPDTRDISESGFSAKWNVLHLNRNYPQQWSGSNYSVKESSFGVDLLLPVDNYQKTFRTSAYAILFIGFTFLVFFFIEVLKKVFIHPVQYILVGIALVVFFTLLLSISEYLRFNLAYIISAFATLLLVAAYVKAIIKNLQITGLIVGILIILYGFIFVILQLQDLALLIGSIGVFVILAVTMYFSRKIDWYHLNDDDEKNIM
jgi:inner membrane protein